MRKLAVQIMLCAAFALLTVGCSEDDTMSRGYVDKDWPSPYPEAIYGTWRFNEICEDGVWSELEVPTTISFYHNGTYVYTTGYFGTSTGPFLAEGRDITTFTGTSPYIDGELFMQIYIKSMTMDECEITMSKGRTSLDLRGHKVG